MEEFLFWIILIPILFYIIVGAFSKDAHPQDMDTTVLEDDYGDE